MAEEVDQASIDVIKIMLESDNGKAFFKQYLAENLKIKVFPYDDGLINITLVFNGMHFSSASFKLTAKAS